MTQSAVSHRVRRLEKFLGQQLIRRLNPGIALTEAGAALLPELATALDSLARLGTCPEKRLRVAAGSALCTWWLAGRLQGFMARRPGISIELVPIENDTTSLPEVDVRILWLRAGEDTPRPAQVSLFTEQVFPVCSPSLLPRGLPLKDPRALSGMTLLHKATNSRGEWTWDVWFEYLGLDAPKRSGASGGGLRSQRSDLRFADMSLMMAAAIDGAGVSLTRSLIAHGALRSGRLVIPIDSVEPMQSTKLHVARWRRAKADDPDIKAFVDWLVAEARTTLAETETLLGPIQLVRAIGS